MRRLRTSSQPLQNFASRLKTIFDERLQSNAATCKGYLQVRILLTSFPSRRGLLIGIGGPSEILHHGAEQDATYFMNHGD